MPLCKQGCPGLHPDDSGISSEINPQPVPAHDHPHSDKGFPAVQRGPPVCQSVPVAPGPVTGLIPMAPCAQVSQTSVTSEPPLLQAQSSSASPTRGAPVLPASLQCVSLVPWSPELGLVPQV